MFLECFQIRHLLFLHLIQVREMHQGHRFLSFNIDFQENLLQERQKHPVGCCKPQMENKVHGQVSNNGLDDITGLQVNHTFVCCNIGKLKLAESHSCRNERVLSLCWVENYLPGNRRSVVTAFYVRLTDWWEAHIFADTDSTGIPQFRNLLCLVILMQAECTEIQNLRLNVERNVARCLSDYAQKHDTKCITANSDFQNDKRCAWSLKFGTRIQTRLLDIDARQRTKLNHRSCSNSPGTTTLSYAAADRVLHLVLHFSTLFDLMPLKLTKHEPPYLFVVCANMRRAVLSWILVSLVK